MLEEFPLHEVDALKIVAWHLEAASPWMEFPLKDLAMVTEQTILG